MKTHHWLIKGSIIQDNDLEGAKSFRLITRRNSLKHVVTVMSPGGGGATVRLSVEADGSTCYELAANSHLKPPHLPM